ncbi:immunoglobulin lambda-1 light chain-like [Paroedura picta]|uniref:immunoglobulin lambda-1 light chain-like n=1 Tax=Paroedura picta TaxID=143630 RepID=UPI004055F66D
MAWPLIVLLLGMCCTGSHSQSAPSQPPSVSVALGNTVKLSCSGISGYYVYWYQQKPGTPPRYLLYYYSDSSKGQGSGVPSRFSGSKDASGSTGYLTIAGALAEDEADYYCAYWPSNAYVFGGGTHLAVTDPNQPSLPPNVNLFPPSVEEKESKNKATLVCLMDGFRPPDITVTWLADGTAISTGVETTKPTKVNNNYVASSYLTLNPSEWESHASYSCKVTHKGIDYVKSVGHSGSPCSYFIGTGDGFLYSLVSLWWVFGGGTQLIVTDANQPSLPPNVNLFPPSVEEKESKNKATLVCLMDGFRPPDITVTWLADGTAISTGVETTKPTKLNDNYVASSYLTLNPSEWESHTSYSCKVTHKGIDYVKSVGHSGSPCS